MITLEELKQRLGTEYQFQVTLSLENLRKILNSNYDSFADEVVFVLNAGFVNIEATIYLTAKGLTIGYDCCIKDRELNGDWISYDVIPDEVNLDVDDMEAEMFRVLDKFVTKHGLSYFAYNDSNLEKRKGAKGIEQNDKHHGIYYL
jgi:hypothetical protein